MWEDVSSEMTYLYNIIVSVRRSCNVEVCDIKFFGPNPTLLQPKFYCLRLFSGRGECIGVQPPESGQAHWGYHFQQEIEKFCNCVFFPGDHQRRSFRIVLIQQLVQ